ncbi:hypothetical protein [uncultured Polaribacter sp.]|uniref:hypothetical protein n=1 Tax=uncultured Polaribacter sp. TaxID=174711 RepID=UPI002622F185|nr:hypothetical protein [uncultured Polaribacter sp.]
MQFLPYILLFYIGFYFYRLAENHQKNKWLFGFIGIVIYFLGAIVHPVYLMLFSELTVDEFDLTAIGFKSFTLGLVFVFVSFQILNGIWNRKKKIKKEEIERIGE